MSALSTTHTSSLHLLSPLSFLSLLLLVLLTCPVSIVGQTCNRHSCSPDQGSLPTYPANSCDLCTNGSCDTAYYNTPGSSCGYATLTVNGAVRLRRTQCCPTSYDGESEFVCVSQQHSEEDGVVDGYSCVKVGAMVSLLRVGMVAGAAVCAVLFALIGLCVWWFCIQVPTQQQFVLPQYQQPLMDNVKLLPHSQPSQPVAAYQPPAPHAPLMSEHRPQYDQPSVVGSQQ